MTSSRCGSQTARVTERCAATGAIALTQPGSSCVDTLPNGADAIARTDSDRGTIIGSSAMHVVSAAGEDFPFSISANGWATVDYVS